MPTIPEEKRGKELLEYFLKRQGLTLQQINLLLQCETLVVILDGYDEIREPGNFYLQNHWDRHKIKMVTACRHEVLQRQANINNREWFYPGLSVAHTPAKRFSEIILKPFTAEQIHQYVADYVKQHPVPLQGEFKDDWDEAATYESHSGFV